MSQDKEYIPEWKQPHIGSEAKKRFVTFQHEDESYSIRKRRIGEIWFIAEEIDDDIYDIQINNNEGKVINAIRGSKQTLQLIYQSILDQLNQ